MYPRRSPLVPILLALACTAALGQFTPNHPEATLLINQRSAGSVDPADHDIPIAVTGSFCIEVTSASNAETGVILLASMIDPSTGSVFATPWGDTIDIGAPGSPISGVAIVGDGISFSSNPSIDPFFQTDNGSPPTMLLSFTAGAGFNGFRQAFQGVVNDLASPPFFLRSTEAADANFFIGQDIILMTGDDGVVTVPFVPGNVFNFIGVTYTDVHVCGNGFVTFGAPTSTPAAGFTIDSVAWVAAEPSIAAVMADWSPLNGVHYQEFGLAGSARIAWGDPITDPGGGVPHFADVDTNRFSIELELSDAPIGGSNPLDGEFTIDYTFLDPTANTQRGDGLTGHTSGIVNVPTDGQDWCRNRPHPVIPPQMNCPEEYNSTGGNASIMGYDGLGSPRAYKNVLSWSGVRNTSMPLPSAATTGDSGYFISNTGPIPEDATHIDLPSISSAGGQMVTIVGRFDTFNNAGGTGGQVIFDPTGAALPATVIGILDGAGVAQPALPNVSTLSPYRDGEGLVITTPGPLPMGNVTMRVIFLSGTVFDLTVLVTSPGSTLTSYTLPDDGFTAHTLQPTTPMGITHYGTNYTTFNICSNGFITFAAGSGDFSETMTEFFDGWGSPPNPGVAVAYSDLNRGGTGSGATYDVIESSITGQVDVRFVNQNWWSSQDPAGTFTCTFNQLGAGSVILDYTTMTAGITNIDDMIFGVTDGDTLTGTDTDLSDGLGTGIAGVQGTYSSSGMAVTLPDSIGELVPANTAPLTGTGPGTSGGTVTFFDVAGTGNFLVL